MKKLLSFLFIILLLLAVWMVYVNMTDEGPQLSPQPVANRAAEARKKASSMREPIHILAQELNLRIISYEETGYQATVAIEAIDDHSLPGRFLEELQRRGIMRDFETVESGRMLYADQMGRRHYRETYIIKW